MLVARARAAALRRHDGVRTDRRAVAAAPALVSVTLLTASPFVSPTDVNSVPANVNVSP